MSYDLAVWTVAAPELPGMLPEPDRWDGSAGSHARVGRGWQVVVTGPHRVAPEDVPDEVQEVLPGIGFMTEVSLEPLSAPKSAMQLVVKTARAIGRGAHGAVADPQEGTVRTPSGVKRFAAAGRPDRFSVVDMRWWFTDGPLLDAGGLDAFLGLLRRSLPEALPKRYGLFEPPQHRLEETGYDHFRGFLAEHIDEIVVWYPSRPVVNVSIHPERDWGESRLGFRCGYVSVGVEAAALSQPGWHAGLAAFWRRASGLISPFYGEVRTLGGYIRSGATYAVDMETDESPTRGPFWRGVPRDPGQACVCGPRYLSLWPRFAAAAEMGAGLGFVEVDDWLSRDTVLGVTGAVPDSIAQRHTPSWVRDSRFGGWVKSWNTAYPPAWPFGERPPPDAVRGVR